MKPRVTASPGLSRAADRRVASNRRRTSRPRDDDPDWAAFHPSSYGFRPGRRCRDALREVDGLIKEGYAFVVDADLESCFDSIPAPDLIRGRLMERVEQRISDGRVLGLIRGWLDQDIVSGMGRWTPPAFAGAGWGTPRGARRPLVPPRPDLIRQRDAT